MKGFGIWGVGLAGSIAAHLAVIPVLSLTIEPDPLQPQPQPQSEIEIQAYQVDRTEAQARQPDAETAASGDTGGATLNNGAIAQSTARAQAPDATKLTQVRPDTDALPSADAQAVSLSSTTTGAETVAPASSISPTNITPLTPQVAEVANLDAPDAMRVDGTIPAAQHTAATPPPKSIAIAADQTPIQLAAATPPAEKGKADFAWESAPDAQIDAKSLATIQSFMQPGDLSGQTGEVRDGIADLLATVPCARLQAVFIPETGSIDLLGHIPEDGLRGPVLEALQNQIGAGIPVRDNMRILPRPQCGALSGISSVGLPQSTDQLTNPLIVGADAHAREFNYVKGDRLTFDLTAPDYDAFIYVDFFDAGGQVIHLVPNDVVALSESPSQSVFQIGVETPDAPSLNITIGPPYGQEIAVAFAASAPLYDGIRPISEPAEAYLDWLRDRVSDARAADPDFKGEWVYFFVATTDQ